METRKERDIDMLCIDCKADTEKLNEFYMVNDELWKKAVPNIDDREQKILCVGCLEARIGRKLCPSDFTDVPVNQHKNHSPRLLDRLTAS